jgi:hypothetical protein
MGVVGTIAYLGDIQINEPNLFIGSNIALINPFSELYNYQIRNDEFSASLQLAYPGTIANNLGMTSFTDDIALVISANGNARNATPSGSGQLYPSSSLVSSGSYNWNNNGYQTSLFISGAQNLTSIPTQSLIPFGSQSFVFEGWFSYQSPISAVSSPLNQFFFGNVSGDSILMDISGPSGNLFRFNMAGPGNANLTGASNYTQNIWYHLAFVRTPTSQSLYLNGNRISNAAISNGSVPYAAGQTDWDVLGSTSINDGAAKLAQDVRLYIGTDKNYTASVITPPDSMLIRI